MSKDKTSRVIFQFVGTNDNTVLGSTAISGLPKLPIATLNKASNQLKQVLHNKEI